MEKILLLIAVFFITILSVQASADDMTFPGLDQQMSIPETVEKKLTADEIRQKKEQEWILDAQFIVDETEDEEANQVLLFFLEHVVLGKPAGKIKAVSVEKGKQPPEKWFLFVPLAQADNQPGWWTEKYFNVNAYGGYDPNFNVLVLKPHEDKTKYFKGLLLLHEAFHLRDLLLDGKKMVTEQEYGYGEAAVRDFINRLVVKLGGKTYEKLVAEEVEKVFDVYVKSDFQQLPLQGDYYWPKELQPIFGPVTSLEEKSFWYLIIFQHAVFQVIESTVPLQIIKMSKAYYIVQWYKQNQLYPAN